MDTVQLQVYKPQKKRNLCIHETKKSMELTEMVANELQSSLHLHLAMAYSAEEHLTGVRVSRALKFFKSMTAIIPIS